jgi:hypothetical protein
LENGFGLVWDLRVPFSTGRASPFGDIVQITATAVEIQAFAVEWHSPHEPVVTGTPVATFNLDESALVAAVSAAIEKARTPHPLATVTRN